VNKIQNVALRLVCFALPAIAAVGAPRLRADESENSVVEKIKDLGGDVSYEAFRPGTPVVRVEFTFADITDDDLKVVSLSSLKKLSELRITGSLTPVG